MEIGAHDLSRADYQGDLAYAKTKSRRFMETQVLKLGMDPSEIVEINIDTLGEWAYTFDGQWNCEHPAQLQQKLHRSFRCCFGISPGTGQLNLFYDDCRKNVL